MHEILISKKPSLKEILEKIITTAELNEKEFYKAGVSEINFENPDLDIEIQGLIENAQLEYRLKHGLGHWV